MKTIIISFILLVFSSTAIAETGHENFMNSNIKTNSSGDFNHWVHGANDFQTLNSNDWNSWKFSYLGLEGTIHTSNTADYTSWEIDGLNFTISNANGEYNNWELTGEDKTVSLTTSNWNTWAISGALTAGISSTVTDDFSEWSIQGGDWAAFSPQYRASIVFLSVFSSAVLKDLSE